MKRYFRISRLRILGAPIYLHWSAMIIVGLCALTSFSDPVSAVSAVCSYLGFILLHEVGHGLAARHYGYRVFEFRLSFIHGQCVYECGAEDRWHTAVIAWGGVLAQFAVAIPVWLLFLIPGIEDVPGMGPVIAVFGYVSPLVALVNLAPTPYLDGEKAWPLIPMLFANLRRRKRKSKPARSSRLKLVK